MWTRAIGWRCSNEAALLMLVVLLAEGCGKKGHSRVGDDLRMGPFTLRVASVTASQRSQTVPFVVEIWLRCDGGNRFERLDFGRKLSRERKVLFSTAQGWSERAWLNERGEDFREFVIQVSPPPKSTGLTLEIANPYANRGDLEEFRVDLGR